MNITHNTIALQKTLRKEGHITLRPAPRKNQHPLETIEYKGFTLTQLTAGFTPIYTLQDSNGTEMCKGPWYTCTEELYKTLNT